MIPSLFSGFNPATFNPASAFGGLGAAAGAGGAAAGAAAGAGGAASGLLGMAGGPIGMGVSALTSIAGGIMANKAAEASMRNARNRQWETGTFNIAGDEYQKDKSYGRQLRAKLDEDKLRQAGVTAFDDFQNLLNTGRFTSAGASRALSSPLFSRS
jgi:hypothetical protein